MNDSREESKILTAIKVLLASHVGVDPEDITEDDTFLQDLHMRPSEFSDFLEELSEKGLDTSNLDLPTIKTVGDLAEALSSHEYTE